MKTNQPFTFSWSSKGSSDSRELTVVKDASIYLFISNGLFAAMFLSDSRSQIYLIFSLIINLFTF